MEPTREQIDKRAKEKGITRAAAAAELRHAENAAGQVPSNTEAVKGHVK